MQPIYKSLPAIEPLPDGLPEGNPIWQYCLARTRGRCPHGDPDLERILVYEWEVILRWIARLKWGCQIDIPPNSHEYRRKKKAEVLLALLNLCEALHTIGGGSQHRNAGEWFREIGVEWQIATRWIATTVNHSSAIPSGWRNSWMREKTHSPATSCPNYTR
jgi:hypothetical protein